MEKEKIMNNVFDSNYDYDIPLFKDDPDDDKYWNMVLVKITDDMSDLEKALAEHHNAYEIYKAGDMDFETEFEIFNREFKEHQRDLKRSYKLKKLSESINGTK